MYQQFFMFKFKFTPISDTSINYILFVTLLELRILIFTLFNCDKKWVQILHYYIHLPMCSFGFFFR